MGAANRLLPLLVLVSGSLFASAARADDDAPAPPPPPPPGYPQQGYPQPVYPAPLSQTTQGTYVPQSVAMSGPEEITNVDDAMATPAGYTAIHRKRKGLIIGGAVTLGSVYGVCLLTWSIGEDSARHDNSTNEVAAMWVPVAGPFIQMGDTDSATARVFLFGLGAAQAAGAIMLYYGLSTEKRVFVRNDLVGSVQLAPLVANHASGLSLVGHF